ncbi:ABC transporter substrate-binding protein [Paraglaciecola aquimarina]|uniref:ABC transporter substrate-binding protein n=1 Tax=Paraglaciecola aquimarina TaxID=1235557 RepID=A0ABU3SUT0_9ALTE|nr:ABC transporter substrate-binding protein [Paraglaciecola aquimarina]MDU0353748.1 ABC transporter substrate-binding protein [Paraglaciecola aquimarina]
MKLIISRLSKALPIMLLGCFICIVSLNSHATKSAIKPNVLFIYPVGKGFPFWDSQVDFAQAVAKALDIQLDIAYPPVEFRNRFNAAAYISEQLDKKEQLPDMLITSFWLGSEEKIMSLLQEKNIDLISINSDISPSQYLQLGKPRERFSRWLATLSPNDTLAGKLLAKSIIQSSRKIRCPLEDCRVNIFAISGLSYSAVSKQRIVGLERMVYQDRQSRLLNIVFGNWDRQLVASMVPKILSRHQDIHAYWVASDVMAYGIEDGLNQQQLNLPSNTIIGGIDWSAPTIDKIRSGEMQVSVGGHFLEAGWSLILYYDYINGADFADELGTIIKTQMSVLNKDNIELLGPFLQSPSWSTTMIKKYSKQLNPARQSYNLNPQQLILEHSKAQVLLQ